MVINRYHSVYIKHMYMLYTVHTLTSITIYNTINAPYSSGGK